MYTFGYSFKTWDEQKSFADGPSILKYINEAADEYKVRDNIIYQQRALCYNFDTKEKWTITTENTSTAEETIYTCQFIFSCRLLQLCQGYTPNLPINRGLKENNPSSKWPENLNVVDKTIIVEVELLLSLLCPRPLRPKWLLCCNDHQPILPLCRIKIKLPLE
jgi:cation diffusion facilitator CzcD-associated flavoprotein CzcO